MGFIRSLFQDLGKTSWPNRHQRWHDFISILEYSLFYAVIIFIFDKLLTSGLTHLIDLFN